MKKVLALALALCMALSLVACGGAESAPAESAPAESGAATPAEGMGKNVTFRMADNQADGTPNVEGDKKFIELVSQYTDGTVAIELHNNAVLGDETAVADMLEADTLDLARISTNGIAGTCPDFNIFGMPYLFASDDAKYAALDGEFGSALTSVLKEKTGLVNLTYFVSGARSFYTTKKPIREIPDMAGMKLRAQDDPVTIAMIKALGGAATPMNYSEVYSALETGVIDGAENDFASYYSSGHYEVAPYYSLDMHTAPSSLVVMSAGAWNSLSAAQQEGVMKAAAEASLFQRDLVEDYNADCRAKVEEAGCEVIEVDVAAFQEICAAVYDDYPDLQQYKDMIG